MPHTTRIRHARHPVRWCKQENSKIDQCLSFHCLFECKPSFQLKQKIPIKRMNISRYLCHPLQDWIQKELCVEAGCHCFSSDWEFRTEANKKTITSLQRARLSKHCPKSCLLHHYRTVTFRLYMLCRVHVTESFQGWWWCEIFQRRLEHSVVRNLPLSSFRTW